MKIRNVAWQISKISLSAEITKTDKNTLGKIKIKIMKRKINYWNVYKNENWNLI